METLLGRQKVYTKERSAILSDPPDTATKKESHQEENIEESNQNTFSSTQEWIVLLVSSLIILTADITMKDTNFTIKISDFLTGNAFEDKIQLSDKFSTSLPQLYDGISCDVCIKNGDEKTVFLEISDIRYSLKNSCDLCAQEYIQQGEAGDLFLKCYANYDEELLREDELSFDAKHGSVNLEATLTQEVLLAQELKKMCNTCEEKNQSQVEQKPEGNSIKRIIEQ